MSLATQYFLGRGVSQDYKQAANWYELAAAQGDLGSCYVIASLYEQGTGVPQDLERAQGWYAQAAARGDLRRRNQGARIATAAALYLIGLRRTAESRAPITATR